MPLEHRVGGAASHHDCAYYGSFAAVWHYMRAWVAPLHGLQLAQLGHGRHLTAVQQAWARIAAAHAAVDARADRDTLLPADARFPRIYSRFDDGRLSPASVVLGGAPGDDDDGPTSAHVLYDLDACDQTCHLHASMAASTVVSSHSFLALYDSNATTPTGRARLLDGSIARGPFSFWRRVPVAHAPDGARTSLFSFAEEPAAFPVALAIDPLLLPPVSGVGDVTVCTMCAPHIADPASRRIGAFDRHWSGSCGHGIRLSGTCHDPAVHAWIVCLDALLGAANVYAERPGGRGSLEQFMAGPGAGLQHRPDIVLRGFDGPQSYTLLDIKTFDAAGATHVASQHTDARRFAAHVSIASHCVSTEYGVLPPRMRLIPLTVSTHGAFGPEATRLLSDLGKRAGGGVPVPLLDYATWAVPRFAPFVRMAVSHAVRRGLAEAVLRRWRRVQDPADVIARPATPVPVAPLLPLAAIPLPDGMLAPLAVHPVGGGPGGAPGGMPHGLFG